MKRPVYLVGLLVVLVLIALIALYDRRPTAGVEPDGAGDRAGETADHEPGALLVDLADDSGPEVVADLEKRYGIDLEPNSIHSARARLERAVTDEARLEGVIAALRREPAVETVEADGYYQAFGWPTFRPNDPSYQYQWHMDQIRMPAAWRLSRGRGVVVAVIDTGVAYADHDGEYRQVPDLAGTRFAPGYDFVSDDELPFDEHGHGTHVTGTIAQTTNNDLGVTGVAFNARIMPLRVLNREGFGSYGDIADAIRYAADHGADVINMSLGGPIPSLAVWSALRHAHARGVVIVAAAGNSGGPHPSFPAAHRHVVGVSATRYDEELAWYSSWGPAVDIAAPGGDVRVDQNDDGMVDGVLQNTILPGEPMADDYVLLNGTSMASPHVAGVAALLVAEGISSPAAVERIMERTARGEGRDSNRYGAGIIDAAAALRYVQLRLGAIQLAIAAMLALLVAVRLRRRGRLDVRPGIGMAWGLVAGSSGLFFLPELVGGLVPAPILLLLSKPIPAWDLVLLGPGGHANPLFYSALLPLVLTMLLFGFKSLRGPIAGLALGMAAHLAFCSLWGTVDVTYLPWGALDHIWLWLNALACTLAGTAVLRKVS